MSLLPWYIPAGGAAIVTTVIAFGAHSLDVNQLEKDWKTKKDEAVQAQADLCESSKQPKKEADNASQTNLANLLDTCLGKLQKPAKCVPVYISRPASGVNAACQQQASGIDSAAIEVNNIECQKDRNGLNEAKIWGQGYLKFINGGK